MEYRNYVHCTVENTMGPITDFSAFYLVYLYIYLSKPSRQGRAAALHLRTDTEKI